MNVEQLRQRVDKARQCVTDLCEGKRRWTMTVPVDLDRDPDVIITDALRDVDALLDIAEELRGVVEAGQLPEAETAIFADMLARLDTEGQR